jgi:nitrogen fixation-related uncharacterized protein
MISRYPDESLPPTTERQPLSRTGRIFLWVFSATMVLTAGSAFVFKLIEFLYSFSIARNTVPGGDGVRPGFMFAISPLVNYLIVAAGFACLFLWAFLSGQFRDIEGPKYRMLELQRQFDRAEAEAGRRAEI